MSIMYAHSTSARALLGAAAFAAGLAVSLPASAQQPASPAAAPAAPAQLPAGSPLIGRPDTEAAMKLAPVPSPPLPAGADALPVKQLKLPKGFNIEVYASGIPNARSLRVGDKGTVFVGNRLLDKVWAIYEKDGKR